MLASSSRNVLKRAQSKLRHVAADASAAAAVAHGQRRYASASQLAVDLSGYAAPTSASRSPSMGRREGSFRGPTQTSLARYNFKMAKALDDNYTANVMAIAQAMKKAGVKPDLTTYNHILDACAREKLLPEARAVFQDMLAMGVRPDRQTFHFLMRSLALFEQNAMQEFLIAMEVYGIAPNEVTYEIIISRLANADRIEFALQYLSKLPPLGLSPTLNTATAIIQSAASIGFARLALDLAVSFEETSVRRLDGDVWVDLLASCAESSYADGTIRTWEKVVRDFNILPDEGLCLQVLHTAARHGLSKLALDVIEVLKSINIVWCEHHIAPVIEAMCRQKDMKEAMLMLDFMRKNDIAPTLETAAPIFEHINHDTIAVDAAWGQLEMLHEAGHAIDVIALNVVIQAAVHLRDLQRAIGTYKACAKLDVKPDRDTFNLLLRGCVDARHRELGDRLLADMKEAGIQPDPTTYERMVRLCLTQSTYEDAFFYLEEMKSLGMVPPRGVYESLIRKLVSVGDVRHKLALEELQECGYEITPRLKSFIDSGGAHDGPSSPAVSEQVYL